VVLTLPSQSNALPSHTAIPKVGNRTPTIVSDAHGSYSRFLAAALTLVVPLLPSPSIAAGTVHRCRRRPTHFPVIRESLRLVAELLQLYQTFALIVPSLRSPSNALPSHLAIPKVGSRTLTIVPDTHGSYSRLPTAALMLVVQSLPSPSNALPSHLAIPKVGNGTPTV